MSHLKNSDSSDPQNPTYGDRHNVWNNASAHSNRQRTKLSAPTLTLADTILEASAPKAGIKILPRTKKNSE